MRKIPFAVGEYYHIYNRGVDRREIFLGKNDYDRFTALLYLCNTKESMRVLPNLAENLRNAFTVKRKKTLVDICAYTLMPNHFHILLREKEDKGASTFMQKMTTAYTMYFNTRNDRSGSLFQGPFKAEHADNDRYLKYLISYIHLNPIKLIEPQWKESGVKDKKRAQEFLNGYKYSSFQDFYGIERPQNSILTVGSLPEYFSTPTNYKESIKEFIEYQFE